MDADGYQRFSDRFFRLSPLYADPGWYFRVRGEAPVGPYSSRTRVETAAREYAEQRNKVGESGGRNGNGEGPFA